MRNESGNEAGNCLQRAQQKPSLDEMKKVKNICEAVIGVLLEHLIADGLVVQEPGVGFL